jgi:predicted nucleotidyltransferase
MEACDLATYVKADEADAFTRVFRAESLQRLEMIDREAVQLVSEAVAVTLGSGARVTVVGSVAKQTAVSTSDLDLLVETQEPVSFAQRKALELRLQEHPAANAAHVKLKKLAIHAQLLGVDMDIVCSNTVEFGRRPPPDERVAADPAVALTSSALKTWSRHAGSLGRKVPGHALESLALYCRSQLSAAAVGDCAMQLFVSVLQHIFNGGTAQLDLRAATRLDKATRSSLWQRAQMTLHVFAVSRMLLRRSSFRTGAEVHAWVFGLPGVDPPCVTPAGAVPCWLLESPATQRAKDYHFAEFAAEPTMQGEETNDDICKYEARSHDAVRILLNTPLGRYTTAGAPKLGEPLQECAQRSIEGIQDFDVVPMIKQMKELAAHADRGSAVAQRMLRARMLWLDGERFMRGAGAGVPSNASHAIDAVECFAAALRASVSDGDPFSGWRIGESAAAYAACSDNVLASRQNDADALLLRAWALSQDGRWADAEAVHTAVIESRIAPEDARRIVPPLSSSQ